MCRFTWGMLCRWHAVNPPTIAVILCASGATMVTSTSPSVLTRPAPALLRTLSGESLLSPCLISLCVCVCVCVLDICVCVCVCVDGWMCPCKSECVSVHSYGLCLMHARLCVRADLFCVCALCGRCG